MPNSPKKQGEESIDHFSHKHKLFFYRTTTDLSTYRESIWCVACNSNIRTNEEYLSCERCEFHMHKSCAELPRKLKHPFHQQHSITLLDEPPWRRKDESSDFCYACGEWCTRFVYECSECKFYVHSKCAMLFPTTRLLAKQQKLRHPHPLIVCERKLVVEPDIIDFQCGACQLSVDREGEIDYSTLIYVCLECHAVLHKSCANLPQNITQHPLHPDCTLTFRISLPFMEHGNPGMSYGQSDHTCDFCRYFCRLYFQCLDCSIKMDIRCALLTPCTTTNYKPVGELKDNGHPHPLIHCNNPVNRYYYDIRSCGGCGQHLEESAYYCVSCKMFLNKSCAELPHVIQHPFHPHHQLTLSYSLDHLLGKKIRCNACLIELYASLSYGCDLCEFYLHPKCASPILYPMIYLSELHQHPLAYSDNIPYESKCSKCTQNIIRTGFRCVHCKFDVHDHCLPLLPPAVKTKWHRHPLILTHGPIKGDPDEVYFYCDCCEDKRDSKHPTYYCAKCHLISHVRCVMWEVMDYLQGKSTKVEKLCNTKVFLIGEPKAMYSIYAAAAGNKDRVLRLRYKIDKASAELMELEAKLEKYQKKYVATSLKLKDLENRLYKCVAHKTEFK